MAASGKSNYEAMTRYVESLPESAQVFGYLALIQQIIEEQDAS